MISMPKRIILLDDISQARIRSAVQILSLNDIVIELVKNALDAQATSVRIVLNYSRGFCSVLDNGCGIPAREFGDNGRLARPYCTSKAASKSHVYGRYGRHLAAIAGVALVCIASRTEEDQLTSVLWCDDSGRLSSGTEASDALLMEDGTEVKVYNLFSKLPVRHKHLMNQFSNSVQVQKEFDHLRHMICGLILASERGLEVDIEHSMSACRYHHRPVSLFHTNPSDLRNHAGVEAVVCALRQAGYIEKPYSAEWRETTIESDDLSIHAVICLEPVPHRSAQFISINHEPSTKQSLSKLYELVNAIFTCSSFGATSDQSHQDKALFPRAHKLHSIHRPSRSLSKGVDRWPMFVLWIKSNSTPISEVCDFIGIDNRTQALYGRIESLIETAMTEFLLSFGFIRSSSPQLVSTPFTEHFEAETVGSRTPLSVTPHSYETLRPESRIKSSSPSAMNNILRGLPFHRTRANNEQYASRLISQRSRYDSGSDDRTSSDHQVSGSEDLVMDGSSYSEQVIRWLNPQNGQYVLIDPRTGMALPKTNLVAQKHTNHEEDCLHEQDSSPIPDIRRNRHRASALSEIAQNIKRYSTAWPDQFHLPVRSIAIFDDVDKHPSERIRTYDDPAHGFLDFVGRYHTKNEAAILPRDMQLIKREGFGSAKVIGQVDTKFILIVVPKYSKPSTVQTCTDTHLILVDQHAADERRHVEKLLRSIYDDDRVILTDPLKFELSRTETRMLLDMKTYFARWHISIDALPQNRKLAIENDATTETTNEIQVSCLPAAVAERCRLNPKLIIDLLREEIWSDKRRRPIALDSTSDRCQDDQQTPVLHPTSDNNGSSIPTSDIPSRLLDLVNSRACRSAIMFNDELSRTQCEEIVYRLSDCNLPFQCAHGRPSMAVVSDISSLPENTPLGSKREPLSIGELFKTDGGREHADASSQMYVKQTSVQDYRSLNTVDHDEAPTFGQAYRSWINQNSESMSIATIRSPNL